MSVKDPFSIFADELTHLRNDIKKLQRSSLNRDEAQALTDLIGESLQEFMTTAESFDEAVGERLALAKTEIIEQTIKAASSAASGAITASHTEIMAAAQIYAKNTGEARREAWRYFGGFWVWLVSIGTLGVILGVLATIYLQGILTADAFGKYPGIYCSSAGGEKGKLKDGRSFCVFYLD